MMRSYSLARFTGILLSAVLLLGTIPVDAIDSSIPPVCDEAYYATTDYYGNLNEGGVVKSYTTNRNSALMDYGTYDDVINLTDSTVPTIKGGTVSFDFSGKTVPEHFYFEGKSAAPFHALPWVVSVHYTLNGNAVRAEELSGKTGLVEICLDALPNSTASTYARNNYVLIATAIFNQDDILSLEAPGAQVQLLGNLRTAVFICLPGEEAHNVIRVGSEDFSFGGLTLLMIPATLSQLDQLSKLSERKDDLEENYVLLSDSLDTLLDSVGSISGNLRRTADGLEQLELARVTISEGKGKLYDDTDQVRSDLNRLAEVVTPIKERAASLSQLVTDTKVAADSLTDSVIELDDLLEALEETLDDIEDYDCTENLRGDLTTLQSSLEKLKIAAASLVASTASESYESQLDKILSLHDIYVTPDFTAFLAKMLVLAGKTDGAETAQAAATQLAPLAEIDRATAETIGQAENWNNVQQMYALFRAVESGISFELFCTKIMLSQGVPASQASETAETMGQIWTICSGSDAEGQRDRAALALLIQNLDSISASVQTSSAALLSPTDKLLNAAASLCDDLESLLKIIDSNGLIDSGKEASASVRSALNDINTLRKLLNDYEPTLQDALKNLQSTSLTAVQSLQNLEKLLADTEALLHASGNDLDLGTRNTLQGLAASLRSTASSFDTTDSIRNAKSSISSVIEDTWNEYTGDDSSILLMDSTAEAVSLTDERNAPPQSIQVLIRTQEIKSELADNAILEEKSVVPTTFWQRVAQMFRDLWTAVVCIFR